MPTLADWMTPDPAVVARDASLQICAAKLLDRRIRHLPVVGDDGAVVGLLGDARVFGHGRVDRGSFEPYPTQRGLKALDLAAQDYGLPASTAVVDVLKSMLDTVRDAVVAVDQVGRPVGLLTQHDLLRHAADSLSASLLAEAAMQQGTYTVRPSDPIRAAWVILQFHGFRHLPVVDAAGALVGIVSLRDLEEAHADRDLWRAIEEVMAPVVETAGRHESVRVLANRMRRQKVGCIPIVEGARLLGLVTRTDVLRALLAHLESGA